MTKRGLTVDINEQICPDRWSYSFDGKHFTAREEFDDIAEDELKELAERWLRVKESGRTAEVVGRTLLVTRESTQELALKTLAIEGVRQASVLGLIEWETVMTVIADTLMEVE